MAGVSIAYELAAHQSVAVVEMESTLAYHCLLYTSPSPRD